MRAMAMTFFLGLGSIQICNEPTEANIGSYIDLSPDLKNSKSILNIRYYNYNCLKLSITAWLHHTMDLARRESKYVNNPIEARQRDEDDFGYIIRTQKLYYIIVWVYTSCGEGKVELLNQWMILIMIEKMSEY